MELQFQLLAFQVKLLFLLLIISSDFEYEQFMDFNIETEFFSFFDVDATIDHRRLQNLQVEVGVEDLAKEEMEVEEVEF